MVKMKFDRTKLAAILAAIIIASMSAVPAAASGNLSDTGTRESTYSYSSDAVNIALTDVGRRYISLKNISNKSVWSYTRPTVTVGSKTLSTKGLVINGVYYIPFRLAAGAIGASYNYNSSTKTATMSANGLYMTASNGAYSIYANDRVLFAESPTIIMSDGRMYIPAKSFAKAVGMTLNADSSAISIKGSYSPFTHASKFYREDEVYWLSRIISAESKGEPLLGQIAVGNVVLNRVRSSAYPNTIYGVIFDKKYGVQFSPVLDGSIYNTPTYNCTLAAKIVLEGFDTSGGALFFLQPQHSTSSWIPKNRPYFFTIGKHDFYK